MNFYKCHLETYYLASPLTVVSKYSMMLPPFIVIITYQICLCSYAWLMQVFLSVWNIHMLFSDHSFRFNLLFWVHRKVTLPGLYMCFLWYFLFPKIKPSTDNVFYFCPLRYIGLSSSYFDSNIYSFQMYMVF